uniref:Putative leucine-rich repeat protein, plant-type n=1 Tax=Tanacetum cinerariifolium TaxID=118510 RepID=A0A699JRA5_TANCI|nr:putative leucine-rich repeat protein, plant-type [Tanacetum cinerariifolium]
MSTCIALFLDLWGLLDLSNNNLVGHIPSELTTLIKLKSLNLSWNHLMGRIPEKVGDMKEVESFDLSMNKLSGGLPMSLSSLKSLSSFNLSRNNLMRKIPSSAQLQSLNESSFVVCKTRTFALGDKSHSFFAPEGKPPRRGLNPRPLACGNNLPKVTFGGHLS